MRRASFLVPVLVPVLALAACSTTQPTTMPAAVADRLDQIDAAVTTWADAATVSEAHAAAEEARNLIVGPAGPLYGDADQDGTVAGDAEEGLLPGLDGTPGLVGDPALNACVEADVLGGSWQHPDERWDEALTAIAEWAPGNNTFPTLASHPQRVVGWATLALETDDLDEAHEYASHADIHVNVSRRAYTACES